MTNVLLTAEHNLSVCKQKPSTNALEMKYEEKRGSGTNGQGYRTYQHTPIFLSSSMGKTQPPEPSTYF